MPRSKSTTTTTTTSPVAETLNDSTYPYPTPSTSPALAPTTPVLSLKTPGLQQLTDSTLSLPIGSSLSLRSRSGQSILSQLLAAHKPGRASANDHDSKLASNDVALSQQTFRPKEQQRRSILPSAWTLSLPKSTPVQGFSLSQPRAQASSTSRQPNSAAKTAAVPIASLRSSRNVMEHAADEEDEGAPPSILPSAWLESVLQKLTRTERSTASHYATLPRVTWQDEDLYPRPQPAFPGLGLRSARERSSNNEENRKYRNRTTKDSSNNSNSVSNKALSRRGSVCELALGDDARDAFQKNKPRTLSSAELLSSIAPEKESLKSSTTDAISPLDSAVPKAAADPDQVDDDVDDNANVSTPAEPASATRPSLSTPSTATLTTTRGRFTIESASPSAGACARTRTLSTSSSISATQYTQGPGSSFNSGRATPPPPSHPALSSTSTKPSISLSPASPTTAPASNLRPNSPSMSAIRSSSVSCTPTVSLPPSPSLSPSPSQVRRKYATGPELPSSMLSEMASSSSDQDPNPIVIPASRKPIHQRTHSSSSIHSTTSSSTKRSQVIIPPPTSTSLFQFASFSSISPKIGGSNNGNGQVGVVGGGPGNSLAMASSGSSLPPFGHPRVPTTPARNNFRQLSIQIIEGDKKKDGTDSLAADGRIFSELDGEDENEEDEEMNAYGSSRSRNDSPVFHLESPTVHPLDTKESSCDRRHGSGSHGALLTQHQTMNRVYPSLDMEGGDMTDSMISSYGPRFSCSSVSSTSSSVGSSSGMCHHQHHQHHHAHHSPAYFRQRSLSATHIESTHSASSPSSSLPPRRVPGSAHRGSWTDPFSRNPRGGYSSSLTAPGVCADPHCDSSNLSDNGRCPKEGLCPPSARSSSSSSLPLTRSPALAREGSQSGMVTESVSDVVVKKSATGRMFTVERTIPVTVSSPTRCSRFIVMPASEDICLPTTTTPTTSSSTSSGQSASSSACLTPSPLSL
ncbi:hypothetical protein EMPS_02662 [Entomortierella parvispora]|uniref:Uncharacterized protein n=1 Tax=Entomortierella parvispora TaxID=205924 RepID=A0A9P3LTS5_9FUNG|nr:hypothetical protein EMPS_02662 [Entomortierella parvispora]